MLFKQHAVIFAALAFGSVLVTLAIDLLRAPAWHAFAMLWVWWATDLSHYFGY